MKSDFNKYYKLLIDAKHPEDVFGLVKSEEEVHGIFKRISIIIHPDKWSNDSIISSKAEEAFKILGSYRAKADEKFKIGNYGKIDEFEKITISTKSTTYTLKKIIAEGDVSTVYMGVTADDKKFAVKIVKNVRNNDLIAAERETIRYLHDSAITKSVPAMEHIIPRHIDTFEIAQDGVSKSGIVYPFLDLPTLETVIKTYPKGIDVRDAVWMINRVLGALVVSSQANIVHGAIVPNNIFIDPPTHNGILVGWGFAVKTNSKMTAISSKYKGYYPKEVFDKQPVNSGLDMYMLAKLFLNLIGGNIETNQFPDTTPKPIAGIFRACLLGPKHRTVDPYSFFEEFQEVLNTLYGKRRFRPFTLNS